jgi:hypothetical protein
MDEELFRRYRRWQEADDSGRDDDADDACQALFESALPEADVSLDFTTRTMAAIAVVTESDLRRARRARAGLMWGSGLGFVVAAYFGGGLALRALSSGAMGLLDLFVGAIVRIATGLQTGTDFWTVLSSLGSATSALASDPRVTLAIVAIHAVAIAGLIALQRLLGSNEESFK